MRVPDRLDQPQHRGQTLGQPRVGDPLVRVVDGGIHPGVGGALSECEGGEVGAHGLRRQREPAGQSDGSVHRREPGVGHAGALGVAQDVSTDGGPGRLDPGGVPCHLVGHLSRLARPFGQTIDGRPQLIGDGEETGAQPARQDGRVHGQVRRVDLGEQCVGAVQQLAGLVAGGAVPHQVADDLGRGASQRPEGLGRGRCALPAVGEAGQSELAGMPFPSAVGLARCPGIVRRRDQQSEDQPERHRVLDLTAAEQVLERRSGCPGAGADPAQRGIGQLIPGQRPQVRDPAVESWCCRPAQDAQRVQAAPRHVEPRSPDGGEGVVAGERAGRGRGPPFLWTAQQQSVSQCPTARLRIEGGLEPSGGELLSDRVPGVGRAQLVTGQVREDSDPEVLLRPVGDHHEPAPRFVGQECLTHGQCVDARHDVDRHPVVLQRGGFDARGVGVDAQHRGRVPVGGTVVVGGRVVEHGTHHRHGDGAGELTLLALRRGHSTTRQVTSTCLPAWVRRNSRRSATTSSLSPEAPANRCT